MTHHRACPVAIPTSVVVAILTFLFAIAPSRALAGRIWFDGSRDDEDAPPGKLLTDNTGYWDQSVLTGVEYRYEVEPTTPRDIFRDDASRYGRRLLDGHPSGSWHIPVGITGNQPLVVTFDFKRPCVFREIDVATRGRKVTIKIEAGDEEQGPWRQAFERSAEDCPDEHFHRIVLAEPAKGRYLRMSIQSGTTTYVEEILAWGDAEVSEEFPEVYKPVAQTSVITGTAFASFPGIAKSAASDADFWQWQTRLGEAARQPAVWSELPTWDSITHQPLLPDKVNQPVSLETSRNQSVCAALGLSNTTITQPVTGEVSLGRVPPGWRPGRRGQRNRPGRTAHRRHDHLSPVRREHRAAADSRKHARRVDPAEVSDQCSWYCPVPAGDADAGRLGRIVAYRQDARRGTRDIRGEALLRRRCGRARACHGTGCYAPVAAGVGADLERRDEYVPVCLH